MRIAAGEALALIFEMGSLEKFTAEAKSSTNGSVQEGNKSREGLAHIQGLKAKILNQVRNLSAEAGGKGSTKKDLNSQRNLFKDVLEFLEVLNYLFPHFLDSFFLWSFSDDIPPILLVWLLP